MGVSPVKSMAVGAGAEYREPFQDLLKCGCVLRAPFPWGIYGISVTRRSLPRNNACLLACFSRDSRGASLNDLDKRGILLAGEEIVGDPPPPHGNSFLVISPGSAWDLGPHCV